MFHFVGNADQKKTKTHQKKPPLFDAKFPGKFEEKIHKNFLESGQSNICGPKTRALGRKA